MKKTDTLIIGGGVSGLACARELKAANKDFVLITKVLGGRIHAESAGSEVPYGTAYVCEDYYNMIPFTDKATSGKRDASNYYFFDGKDYISIYSLKNITLIPSLLRFKKILKKFRQHIIDYRAAMTEKSLKEIFEDDEFLNYTWTTPAKDFIREHKLEKLDQFLVNPIVATTTYAESDEINTAYYLGMALPLIAKTWRADFRHTLERMTENIKDEIKIGEVTELKKLDDGTFNVSTSVGEFNAKNIVLAAPQKHLKNLYPNLPKPWKQVDIHVMNVHGTRKEPFVGKPVVFLRSREHNGVYTLFGVKDGVDLVYSKEKDPDLSRYYSEYKIVKDVYWDPVMNVPDSTLIDNKLEDHVYLAGDYNISGLEEAFVSGMGVGRRVLREQK